jgi:hypothetical protein
MSDKSEALQDALKKLKADHDATLEELESAKADVDALTIERDGLNERLEELESELAQARSAPQGKGEKPAIAGYVEGVVLKTYGYRKLDLRDGKTVLDRRLAEPGDKVLLTPDQSGRLAALGTVGTQEQYESQVSEPVSDISDEELSGMSSDELRAYLSQHSDNDETLARVELLEDERGDDARPEILEAIENIRNIKNQ